MRLKIEIHDRLPLTESDHGARAEVAYALDGIKLELGRGVSTAGEILSRDGRRIGHWSYGA